jgi:hypothetical protein
MWSLRRFCVLCVIVILLLGFAHTALADNINHFEFARVDFVSEKGNGVFAVSNYTAHLLPGRPMDLSSMLIELRGTTPSGTGYYIPLVVFSLDRKDLQITDSLTRASFDKTVTVFEQVCNCYQSLEIHLIWQGEERISDRDTFEYVDESTGEIVHVRTATQYRFAKVEGTIALNRVVILQGKDAATAYFRPLLMRTLEHSNSFKP